jgi:hypothetical protein
LAVLHRNFIPTGVLAVKRDSASIIQARQIDLVDYLAQLGHHPTKIRHNDFWYLSPLRSEKNASFKIDRSKNLWYDHGIGVGGDLIDFGMRFYGVSFPDLLPILENTLPIPMAVLRPPAAHEKKVSPILITGTGKIADLHLKEYLTERKIPAALADRYCVEVEFELYGRKIHAIGFKNDSGGYELRNRQIKISSSPKDITTISSGSGTVLVFEGFFDFLSYQAIQGSWSAGASFAEVTAPNFLVLNTLAFFERSRVIMEMHDNVYLYLDRDSAGMARTEQALAWSAKYVDRSLMYAAHKDLNDFLRHGANPPK